jgi:hypothetical protein
MLCCVLAAIALFWFLFSLGSVALLGVSLLYSWGCFVLVVEDWEEDSYSASLFHIKQY